VAIADMACLDRSQDAFGKTTAAADDEFIFLEVELLECSRIERQCQLMKFTGRKWPNLQKRRADIDILEAFERGFGIIHRRVNG
jgi:hypothetical protein